MDEIDRPFEETTNIPFILRFPGRLKKRTESRALISNVDYAPTLLSLCGVDRPSGMQGDDLSGWLTGGRGSPRSSIYSEGDLGSPTEWRMVVRGLDKLVVDYALNPTQLYDLGQDPHEMRNLASVPAARRKRDEMLALLRHWMSRTSDRAVYKGDRPTA